MRLLRRGPLGGVADSATPPVDELTLPYSFGNFSAQAGMVKGEYESM